MAKANGSRARKSEPTPSALSRITVAGFKSIGPERSIEIRPLTLLAGANSSGKSSMMQPLLLLKQTLEESNHDPGPLFLNGPIVKFSSAEEVLFRENDGRSLDNFKVGLGLDKKEIRIQFRKENRAAFRIEQAEFLQPGEKYTLWPEMSQDQIVKTGLTKGIETLTPRPAGFENGQWEIVRDRCFLELSWAMRAYNKSQFTKLGGLWEGVIRDLLYVSGLRGGRDRNQPLTPAGPSYQGIFDKYTASVIYLWQIDGKATNLARLNDSLKALGLTGGVKALRLNDTQLELRVGRLPDIPPERPSDGVNFIDVGIGVSQALPVVTALLVAKPGQLVYIEQPEIHLHPRAQVAMARLLADAANRGVRVVAETHSSLVLLGVQSLVAEGVLAPDKVKLHWFRRNEKTGATDITSADLDRAGAYGDWPEDFADVEMKTDLRYVEAAHDQLKTEPNGKNSPTKARH
jgi:hypothetical protein